MVVGAWGICNEEQFVAALYAHPTVSARFCEYRYHKCTSGDDAQG